MNLKDHDMEELNKVKVLFLVMYSGEGDYEKSIKSAKDQEGIEASFHIVKNLPMKEAHYSIYSYWNEHCEEFDMFVKLDADCVLADNHKIYDIWQIISNTTIAAAVIWVHDFLRNCHVPGLVVGNKFCKFNLDNVTAKAQFDGANVYMITEGYKKMNINSGKLLPAAYHGYYSYPVQLFAQGVKRRIRRGGQIDVYQQALNEFNKTPELLRYMFLIGWELGATILVDNFNYTDPKFIEYYNKTMDILNNTPNHWPDVKMVVNKLI